MGAKIEFCYLSESSNRSILLNIMRALYNMGWLYNKYVKGEYTYWINAPIWNLGDSKTYIESDYSIEFGLDYIEKIIDEISNYYSPTIVIGTTWENKVVVATLSIFENVTNWKEIKFSVDRFDTLDSMSFSKKGLVIGKLKKVFLEIALSIKPFYGIGATEISGLVSSPEMLTINYSTFGDLNYFSKASTKNYDIDQLKTNFNVEVLDNGARFVYYKDELFKLG